MLWTIVRKELSANLMSFRFALIFLLCCTLILVSTYTMLDKYKKRVKEHSGAVEIHKQELGEAAGLQGWSQAASSGYKLDKPPVALSVIAEGIEGAAGKFATINIVSTPALEGGVGGDPMFAYFGTLDMIYIVKVVLSLVAILLTYDAISGEREQGTLKLALSNSVPRSTVLLSKCVGGYITLLLPFLVPTLISLLILTTSGSISFSGEEWIRLGLILLASLLYIGIFLMLGLLVSSRTNRSTTALMMLLFIWVVLVLAVPKASMIVASIIQDVPSVQEVLAEKEAATRQIMAEWQEKIDQHMRDNDQEMRSEETRPNVLDGLARLQKGMFASASKKRTDIQTQYDRSKSVQFQLASKLSRISPASVYTFASTNLARTGFNRQKRFLAAARVYQVGFIQYTNNLIRKVLDQQVQQMQGDAIEEAKFDLEKVPALEFRESSLSESWNLVWGDLLILFLLVACFFMIA